MSSTVVKDRQFRFRDFLRSVEGHVWRVEPAITPFVVSLDPNASNAVNADTFIAILMQLRDHSVRLIPAGRNVLYALR